jgi:hypothetical protein
MNSALKRILIIIGLFLILGAIVSFRLNYFFVETDVQDYTTYIETAKFFAHDSYSQLYVHRIIKPLAPIMVAGLVPFTHSYDQAFMLQVIFFYMLTAGSAFLLFRELFEKDNFWGLAGASLFIFGFPLLGSGLGGYTETGAFFFYITALYTSLLFYKKPSRLFFILTSLLIIIGFFWKVYSAFALVTFVAILLFHPTLSTKKKVGYLLWLIIPFGLIHGVWQWYVEQHFGYTYVSWLKDSGRTTFSFFGEIQKITIVLADLLGIGWLLVPSGIQYFRKLSPEIRKFFIMMTFPLLGIFAWRYISPRLWYPLAPSFIFLSLWGLKNLFYQKYSRVLILVSAVVLNFFWLYLVFPLS